MIDIKVSVHPLYRKKEQGKWGGAFSSTQSQRLQMSTLHKNRV